MNLIDVSRVSENRKEIVRRYYEELWNAWRLELIDELVAVDIVFRGSLGAEAHGREGFRRYVEMVRRTFPDFHNEIEELVAEGTTVIARLTYTGTHHGKLFEFEPTGSRVSYEGAAFFMVAPDGRIARAWVLGDTLGLRRQLSKG
jgi:steroid delta-isomerase-like uncharacterized protein